jgi:hypothetical protein
MTTKVVFYLFRFRPNIGLSCLPNVTALTSANYNLNNCVTIGTVNNNFNNFSFTYEKTYIFLCSGWGKNAFNNPGLSTVLKMIQGNIEKRYYNYPFYQYSWEVRMFYVCRTLIHTTQIQIKL